MLQLNPEQTQALEAIKRRRDLQALQAALAEAFPEVCNRAGDRFAALIEHGAERSLAAGLSHVACVGRYLACWFMLGADFDTKPEFAWARTLLSALDRAQGSRIYQLCRGVREALPQLSGGTMTAALFDAALQRLDAKLLTRGTYGSLRPSPTLRLGEPCDIDAVRLQWLGPTLQQYRVDRGQWQRVATASPPELRLAAGATGAPLRLHALGQTADGTAPSRLQLQLEQARRCDERQHPLISVVGATGLNHWRGRHAESVQIPLTADVEPEGIGAAGSPASLQITAGACGLRESGAAFDTQTLQLGVYPSAQHLLVWRHEAGAAGPSRVRHERDGNVRSASKLESALADLDRQLNAALTRLQSLWERESGVGNARMEAEPAVMAGTAGLSWGWTAPTTLDQPPRYRLAGMLDLIVCQLKLRLSGALQLHGSHSRLELHCSSAERLAVEFESRPEDTDPRSVLERTQTRFRQPFVLQLETLASDAPVALIDALGPPTGAIVGAAGLRACTEGPGLEWFVDLAIEPVTAQFIVSDPVIGTITVTRPLLPAAKLVQWRLG